MDYEGEKLSSGSTATIEEEMREWPENVHTDVAEAVARGQHERQTQVQQAHGRRRLLLTTLTLLLCLGLVSLPLWWYFRRREPVTTAPSSTIAASIPTPRTDINNIRLSVGPTENGENFKKTEASVTSGDQEILKVVKYDFYSGKFIVNNTTLRNEQTMVATFQGLREQLKESWIIIFATTSLEGYEDYNLDLCNRRLYAMKDMLAQDAGISAKGYWGILAGEFKIDLDNVKQEEREDEENRIAQKLGEKWLSDQRRLIVITIRETAPLSQQVRDQVPFVVSKYVYEQGMLPRNYDAPNSTPFPLNGKSDSARSTNSNRSPTP
jgi:hypothetical protein